jgi:hypothetical protein
MQQIPVEIIISILKKLSIYDLIHIRITCDYLYSIIDDYRFYNEWRPAPELVDLLEYSKSKHPQNTIGFSYFFLWFHKYVIYRANCIRHSYGLLDADLSESAIMTVYKTYEYLEALSSHDDSPENYIQTVTELLIGFDIIKSLEQSATSIWELIYGYIRIHCKKHGAKRELIDKFIEKIYTGSSLITKFRNI